MGIKTLNSVGGVSVGLQPANVILSNADVISNNLTVQKTANLGNISNVTILGGSANYFLKTDGQGNLSWAPGGSGLPGGSNTQIQFNDEGSFNGVSNFTYNKTTNLLAVNGNVTVGDNTNNVRLFSSGAISATGNLSAANINTGGVLSVTGNANVGNIGATNGVFTNISGNASGLTNIPAANITGQVANALVAGTVYTNAQPNITSVGTLTSLSVSGNANVGNIGTAGLITATGNIQGGNLRTTGVLSVGGNANVGNLGVTAIFATTLSATGNANVGNIGATNGIFTNISGNGAGLTSLPGGNVTGQVANALVAGTVYTNAQPNITSVGTLTSLSVSGNANVGNIGATNGVFTNVSGNGAALTNLPAANITGQVANALVAGTVYTNAQPNITSVGTLTSLSVSGNANVGNIGATNGVFTNISGNASGLTNIPGANITGQVANALVAGTVYTNAQPNITSVGTLTSLSVSGNANIGNIGTAGLITATGNITGGNILVGTGAGTLAGDDNLIRPAATSAFLNVKGGSGRAKIALGNDAVRIISGADNVQIRGNAANSTDSGSIYATFANTGLSVTGTLSATGNANVANLGVGIVTATGNITAPNFIGAVVGNATGIANGTSNISIPVANGNIVFGTAGVANIVVVSTTGMEITGTIAATSKSFLIEHPTKQGYKLQYGSLESPYHGVRLTGEAVVVNGYTMVKLPDYIRGLVRQEGSQVQITPVRHGEVLWVEEINVRENFFVIKSKVEDAELMFYWSFTAIRKDVDDLLVEFMG